MNRTWRLAPDAGKQIQDDYLKHVEGVQVIAAAEELKREFGKLAANPQLGTAPTGPFENRPIHQFYLECGDRRRLASVSYRTTPECVDILGFVTAPV